MDTRVTSNAPSSQADRMVYQLKVTFMNGEPPMPPIWRRVQVRNDITLNRLHHILQVVMGWENYHLHQFIVDGISYRVADPDFPFEPGDKHERGVKLVTIAACEKARFIYEYDFGDGWEHEIVVEKTLAEQEGVDYPICLGGEGACPPEDVGGIGGYIDFLEAVSDPEYEDHEEMLQWAGLREGEQFDVRAFDLDAINQKLRQLR